MKVLAWLILLGVIFFGIGYIVDAVYADYQYSRDFESNWSLADKASTLEQKSQYIDKFVTTLENADMTGTYNALVFTTPDNSFDKNLEAVKSLQSRMQEIRGMDIKSFEYQQAISQITAQEQGEAQHLLGVFEGCWYMRHHFFLWDWVAGVFSIGLGFAFICSILFLMFAYDNL